MKNKDTIPPKAVIVSVISQACRRRPETDPFPVGVFSVCLGHVHMMSAQEGVIGYSKKHTKRLGGMHK